MMKKNAKQMDFNILVLIYHCIKAIKTQNKTQWLFLKFYEDKKDSKGPDSKVVCLSNCLVLNWRK